MVMEGEQFNGVVDGILYWRSCCGVTGHAEPDGHQGGQPYESRLPLSKPAQETNVETPGPERSTNPTWNHLSWKTARHTSRSTTYPTSERTKSRSGPARAPANADGSSLCAAFAS